MADGPMSTPRRPAPRSSPAPMTATGCSCVSRLPTAARLALPVMNHSPSEDSRIRVLIADDDQPFLESLQKLIDRQPELTVIGAAADGLEAIELADQLDPDAVVLDLHMPLLDGVSAAARLRRDHPSLCLIALTGDDAPALHRAVREAGADEVLLKAELVGGLLERLTTARERG